jgi:hypothetical protein
MVLRFYFDLYDPREHYSEMSAFIDRMIEKNPGQQSHFSDSFAVMNEFTAISLVVRDGRQRQANIIAFVTAHVTAPLYYTPRETDRPNLMVIESMYAESSPDYRTEDVMRITLYYMLRLLSSQSNIFCFDEIASVDTTGYLRKLFGFESLAVASLLDLTNPALQKRLRWKNTYLPPDGPNLASWDVVTNVKTSGAFLDALERVSKELGRCENDLFMPLRKLEEEEEEEESSQSDEDSEYGTAIFPVGSVFSVQCVRCQHTDMYTI